MDLMEYKARELFERHNLPVPPGIVIADPDALPQVSFPAVVKAQLPMGGRGKAGGVVRVNDERELRAAVKRLIGMQIGGKTCHRVMVSPFVDIQNEYYLSIVLDRNARCYRVLASREGGVDIETTAAEHPDRVVQLPIHPQIGLIAPGISYLCDRLGMDTGISSQLGEIVTRLYGMVTGCHLMQAEINPLALTGDGRLLALDAKVTVDDSALYKMPDLIAYRDEVEEDALVAEARAFQFLYVPCEQDGDVAVMSNGSGMLMSCIDLLAQKGLTTCAVLDLGGGATGDRVAEGIRILARSPGAKRLMINIFGGITRCDEIARGIAKAIDAHGLTLPVVARFEGTNKQQGLDIVAPYTQVRFADNLPGAVEAIVKGGGAA